MKMTLNEYGLPMTDEQMKDFEAFKRKSRKEQFLDLLNEAPAELRDIIILQGVSEGFCDKQGRIR